MRYLPLLVIIVLSCQSKNFVGKYNCGNVGMTECGIVINKNHTFLFTCYACMNKQWSYGSWKNKGRFLYFETRTVYDTIRLNDKDVLIKSMDTVGNLKVIKSEKLPFLDGIYKENDFLHPQSPNLFSSIKLKFRKGKLYNPNNTIKCSCISRK